MKITCTVREFAEIVRDCADGDCDGGCALRSVCNGTGIEQFVRADNITDDVKEENE